MRPQTESIPSFAPILKENADFPYSQGIRGAVRNGLNQSETVSGRVVYGSLGVIHRPQYSAV